MRGTGSRFGAHIVRVVLLSIAIATSALPFSAWTARAQDEPVADATLRIIHASPGAPEVDVLVDGQPLIENLAYGTGTHYANITPQEHRLQIIPSGQTANAAVVDETLAAAPGQAYLLAMFGLLNDIQGAIFDVDLSEIEPGNARVRLLNFSPDAGDIDVMETGGDEWFGNQGFGAASDYRDIAVGTYSADIRDGEDRVLRTVRDFTFEETQVYDVVVLGQVADDSIELVSLVTNVSPPCNQVLELEGDNSDSCLLFVHAASDAPPVDVYLNDALIAEGLEYGTATEYAAVPSGEGRGIRVAATDTPVEEAIIDESLDFEPGQAYEILVTGTGDDVGLTVTGTDLRPVAGGQARLRLIHASPDAGGIDLGIAGQDENLFEGVDFGDTTDYRVLDAGDYTLQVRPGGDDTTVALQSDTTLGEGTTYDLVYLGRPEDQSLQLLALTATVPIQVGQVATPEAETTDESVAPTVVPESVEELEGSPTPAG